MSTSNSLYTKDQVVAIVQDKIKVITGLLDETADTLHSMADYRAEVIMRQLIRVIDSGIIFQQGADDNSDEQSTVASGSVETGEDAEPS